MNNDMRFSFGLRVTDTNPAHFRFTLFSNIVPAEHDHLNVTRANMGSEQTLRKEEFVPFLKHVKPNVLTIERSRQEWLVEQDEAMWHEITALYPAFNFNFNDSVLVVDEGIFISTAAFVGNEPAVKETGYGLHVDVHLTITGELHFYHHGLIKQQMPEWEISSYGDETTYLYHASLSVDEVVIERAKLLRILSSPRQ